MPIKPISISDLTSQIKNLLEQNFTSVYITGEVSNYKKHSSGHIYLTLKDQKSQIFATIWKYRASSVKFQIENGMKVVVFGQLNVYERGGNYQVNIQSIEPLGIGDLQLAFEQLKKKLKSEGLFEDTYKKPLPQFPQKIGIVTSPTGAAIKDIISVFKRRFPAIEVIINPVRVQGETAAAEIAKAIEEFNKYEPETDVLIVGRGGGSLEDLWPFNEEIVARAIFNSKIPVISAVGHEIDFTIADFVADYRAPTPSAAAEIAVKDMEEILNFLLSVRQRLYQLVDQKIKRYEDKIESFNKRLRFETQLDQVHQKMQYLDQLQTKMNQLISYKINYLKQTINTFVKQLEALNPTAILERGYSITRNAQTLKIITSTQELKNGMKIQTQVGDGKFNSIVQQESKLP